MSKYTVVVSSRADQMLVEHAKFLAQVSPPAARRMLAEFSEVLDTLESTPLLYPVEEDYNLPRGAYRKASFSKRYKALFTIKDDTVFLDAVLDVRQDNTKRLQK